MSCTDWCESQHSCSQRCWTFFKLWPDDVTRVHPEVEHETLDVKKDIHAGRAFPRCCYLWSWGWAALSWRCTAERWWGQGRERTAAGGTSSPGHRWSSGSSLRGEEQRRDGARGIYFLYALRLSWHSRPEGDEWKMWQAGFNKTPFLSDTRRFRAGISDENKWRKKIQAVRCVSETPECLCHVSENRDKSPCYSELFQNLCKVKAKCKKDVRKPVKLRVSYVNLICFLFFFV